MPSEATDHEAGSILGVACQCENCGHKWKPRGGIVGSVSVVACVTNSDSPWFVGRYGFMLSDPQPMPFVPWRGQLGFFDVPAQALATQAA